jgi:hypothetical protein
MNTCIPDSFNDLFHAWRAIFFLIFGLIFAVEQVDDRSPKLAGRCPCPQKGSIGDV